MKPPYTPLWLLGLSASLLVLYAVAAFTYDTPWAAAQNHPEFSAMESSGALGIEDREHWFLGLLAGTAIILIFTASLLMSANNSAAHSTMRLTILLAGAGYLTAFFGMMMSFRNDAATELVGPFPATTTWMLLAVWSTPLLFTLIYCVRFREWFSEDDDDDEEEEFTELPGLKPSGLKPSAAVNSSDRVGEE
jgi:hypothetical protein